MKLAAMVAQGARAVVLFCMQRPDALATFSADEIDPPMAAPCTRRLHRSVGLCLPRRGRHALGIALVRRIPILP